MLKIVDTLKSLYQNFYQKIYISLVVSHKYTQVYVEISKGNKVPEFATKIFETTTISNELKNYIDSYTAISPYFYISILNNLTNQGAIPSCLKSEMSKFTDIGTCVTVCVDNSWTLYSTKFELDMLQDRYEDFGLDFIFSPFSIINNFFADKVSQKEAMLFVLVQDEVLDISIFENSKLLYAEHYVMGIDNSEKTEKPKTNLPSLSTPEFEDDIADLGDFDDFNDISDLDSLDDIEDLDMIEDIDEFSMDYEEPKAISSKSIAPSQEKHASKTVSQELDEIDLLSGFNQDYRRFSHIKSSLENFYKDSKYNGEFVQNVYIANASTLSDDLKTQLEDELFLNVIIRNIELAHEVNTLAKLEVIAQ